ncbi:MAG: hypothetical protein EG825_07800 [Rhodocyclaceae bacterium]|nr:hypothetical protein [Rhodocyclaceae bacterium]
MKAKYSGVKASYDDKNLKVKGEVSYGQADDEKAGTAAAKTAAQDAAKIKAQTAPSVTLDHGPENTKTLRHVYASKESAKRAARAEWRRLQRGMATFGITLARGRADLMPEMPATVSGWKPQIDSTDWIITRVTHSLDDNGYTTGLELEIKATEVAVENS